jgi:kynureninase
MNEIAASVAALGPGALDEPGLRRHIDKLFSTVLSRSPGRIYLANHSLGRPLDRTAADIEEGLAFWYADLDEAWDHWLAEIARFRASVAALVHAAGPQSILPKASAGQGLRAVLNSFTEAPKVVSTRSEFASLAVILDAYAARGRIRMHWVAPSRGSRGYVIDDFVAALATRPDLLVLSLVFFDTGQFLTEIDEIIALAKSAGTLVLVDLYHAAGAVPVDITALDVDFALGGSYKYLRGGPGAAWLYIHPRHFEAGRRTLDIGWFATAAPLAFERPEPPRFASGADGWLESTPAVLPFYQARAGLEFTLAIGVPRLRAYSLQQKEFLIARLADAGAKVLDPGRPRGAFLAIPTERAESISAALHSENLILDARAGLLRICPDILTRPAELAEAARRVAERLLLR